MDRNASLRMRIRKIIREHAQQTGVRRPVAPRLPSLASVLFEDANPDKIDFERFPMTLSKAAADPDMKDKVSQGTEDNKAKDDIVKVQNVNIAVSSLKPSQSTMKVSNAVGMAIGMIVKGNPGGDLSAFISSDNFIMDGHHRWIASFMVDPSSKAGGKKVALPGKQLVAVLNAITAGKLGNTGNKGSGSFADFKNKDKIKAEIDTVVEKGVPKFDKEGNPAGFFTTPEDAKKAVDEKGGSDKLADEFIKNLSGATLSTPDWAVERIQMPVVNPGENTNTVTKALTGGEVDLNPPYASADSDDSDDDEKKAENAGRVRSGALVAERWQKLAGIIKG